MSTRKAKVAWAAGIIEGEGWVGFGRNRGRIDPKISVGQKANSLMLLRLKELWGGNICRHSEGVLMWAVSNRLAEAAAKELLACSMFQGPKREAAESVVSYYRDK